MSQELPEGPVKAVAPRVFDPDALTRALRIAGAALVVAAASSFMLEHWQDGNDLTKYGMLVGQSLLLAVAAYFVGLTLREGRSARTFLALVIATMPVSFAVLGGLVYSQFHWESVPTLPTYATWVAPSPLAALLAVAGTFVVLVPLAVVSFVALARKEARALSLAFFAGNLLVLVPLRDPQLIAILAGASTLAFLKLEISRFARSAQLDTLEGKLARVMPFAAPAIMIGRVFHLYPVGPAFLGAVLLIAASVLWLLLSTTTEAWKRDFGAIAAAGLAITGWSSCWTVLAHRSHDGSIMLPLLGLPIAGLFVLAARRAVKAERTLVALGTVTSLLTMLLACAVDCNSVSAVGCILVGVVIAVWGASMRAQMRTVSGSVVAFTGLAAQVWLATHADNVLRWVTLSVVGVLLIVGSAYVERNKARIARFWAEVAARRVREQENAAA